MERTIIYYHRHWLPGKTIECILEPQVLHICLMRRIHSLKIVLKPSIYDDFMHSELPAALVPMSKVPLSQDKLLTHLRQTIDYGRQMAEDMDAGIEVRNVSMDDNPEVDSQNAYIGKIHSNTLTYILNTYISTHLRYAVLYLLWLHPLISQFTSAVMLASVPLPYGYYEFYKKRKRIKNKCREYGYYTFEHTLRELVIILHAIKKCLTFGTEKGLINMEEGSIFSNLATLFSIPCKDVKEILDLHSQFSGLKRYCIKVNNEYNVVSLKPPFLSGDTVSVNGFGGTYFSKLFEWF
ncbi:hypothetical protein BEWA_026450 [Theileria equi strain WA]|uniref:Uncharacterized protein n=1 Tax=Theileria equi strain WA TaxID=1537102 RepID=L0AXQ0_THEEQ|nr:hypothetical protein BEWA_026450 [Theileria equi strain WA]AFZ79796.1 hypothetical protein BEWA_026450 [Theileria equi strain WA]|eukprot:XP_004829462.1 hypothetical protein BEWA_026450 [Theileria equi strain WA]